MRRVRSRSLGIGGNNIGNRAQVKIWEGLQQIALGMGVGIFADAAVEVTKLPVLNDSGTFGNSQISNFELFFYGISIAGLGAAIVDIGTGKGILTFSKSMIFYLVGLIMGVYFYENTLATLFKIRKFNPYELVGRYIPPVLPEGTKLPFLPGGFMGPEGAAAGGMPMPKALTPPAKGIMPMPAAPLV